MLTEAQKLQMTDELNRVVSEFRDKTLAALGIQTAVVIADAKLIDIVVLRGMGEPQDVINLVLAYIHQCNPAAVQTIVRSILFHPAFEPHRVGLQIEPIVENKPADAPAEPVKKTWMN